MPNLCVLHKNVNYYFSIKEKLVGVSTGNMSQLYCKVGVNSPSISPSAWTKDVPAEYGLFKQAKLNNKCGFLESWAPSVQCGENV